MVNDEMVNLFAPQDAAVLSKGPFRVVGRR